MLKMTHRWSYYENCYFNREINQKSNVKGNPKFVGFHMSQNTMLLLFLTPLTVKNDNMLSVKIIDSESIAIKFVSAYNTDFNTICTLSILLKYYQYIDSAGELFDILLRLNFVAGTVVWVSLTREHV